MTRRIYLSVFSDQAITDRNKSNGDGEHDQGPKQLQYRADEREENADGNNATDDDEQDADEFGEHGMSFLCEVVRQSEMVCGGEGGVASDLFSRRSSLSSLVMTMS